MPPRWTILSGPGGDHRFVAVKTLLGSAPTMQSSAPSQASSGCGSAAHRRKSTPISARSAARRSVDGGSLVEQSTMTLAFGQAGFQCGNHRPRLGGDPVQHQEDEALQDFRHCPQSNLLLFAPLAPADPRPGRGLLWAITVSG